MPHFRTEIDVRKANKLIDYNSHIQFMGSCFAENVGSYFQSHRFNTMVNPFGVLYNPFSLAQSIKRLEEPVLYSSSDLECDKGLWHSFDHHSKFNHINPNQCLSNINQTLIEGHKFLQKTNLLFITFGTAWVYELINQHRIVANCHKYPASEFNRYLLNVEEIVDVYKDLVVRLKVLNPSIQIIFTVSPVRHWKDGAHGNQISKAILLLAIDKLCELFEDVEYFPAYELLLDDLRDYRFFANDMLHPSDVAVTYIREKFSLAWLSENSLRFTEDMNRLIKAKTHRPFNEESLAHQSFLKKQLQNVHILAERYPDVSFNEELAYFTLKLI